MIDVVRLLKNQEMFEIQRAARGKAGAARVSRSVRELTRTTTSASPKSSKAAESSRAVRPITSIPAARKYLQHIEGLPMGPSRSQGVLKGNRFYHADLGLTLAFPSGWTVENQAERVVALSPAEGQRSADADAGTAAEHGPA